MNAINVMTLAVTSVEPQMLIEDARALMLSLTARHLPVVSNGKLVGIVCDRDLQLSASHDGAGFSYPSLQVGEVMTADPLTADMGTSVMQLARLMLEHKVDAIPIVTKLGLLVGLVTSSDMLHVVQRLLCQPGTRCVFPRQGARASLPSASPGMR